MLELVYQPIAVVSEKQTQSGMGLTSGFPFVYFCLSPWSVDPRNQHGICLPDRNYTPPLTLTATHHTGCMLCLQTHTYPPLETKIFGRIVPSC